jgi:hypothetical protein
VTSPLRTYSYTLTTADALAWEARPRELAGWRAGLLIVWLGAAGGGPLAFLPADWVGPQWGLRFWLWGLGLVGIAWLIAAAAITLAAHRRARRRIPAPIAMHVEEWGDHFAVTAGSAPPRVIAHETIAKAIATPTHVFLAVPPDVVIIPASAFTDEGEMQALAALIEARGDDPE